MGEPQKVEMVLYTGGIWCDQKYTGDNIVKHVMDVPLENLTFSVLMDHVKAVAPNAADQTLTYKSYLQTRLAATPHLKFLAITLSHQMHMGPFLAHVRERLASSRPVDLYLD